MPSNMLTPYSEINDLIDSLTAGTTSLFGERLVGIYLFGSLTYGDFNIESSDIDLVAILKEPVQPTEYDSLNNLHQKIAEKYPQWAKRLEVSYTPIQMLTEKQPPKEPRPYYGEGIFYPAAPYGNEWIINLYLLHMHGRAVVGPEFTTLVEPIEIADVQAACVKDLFTEWEPKLREPAWLDNSHYQAYLVLNLCRILNTVLNASALSKKKSATAIKQEFPEWTDLIQTAESWQYGTEMKQKEATLAFLTFVIAQVKNYQR